MTREEFIDHQVTDVVDLIWFCNDNGLDELVADIYDEATASEMITDYIKRYADDWKDVQRFLEDIPYGCDWYQYDGNNMEEFTAEDFYDLKDEVIEACDYRGLWDEPEPEEEEEDIEDSEDSDSLPEVSEDDFILAMTGVPVSA